MIKKALRSRPVVLMLLSLIAAAGPEAYGAPQEDTPARARLRENISNLYLIRLTRALELTEEQTAKLYPILTRIEKDKAGLQRQMALDLGDLRAELNKPSIGEDSVGRLVARIRKARRAIRQRDDEVESALEGVLSPVQKARYLVFTVEFMRNVRENVQKARGLRTPVKRSP